MAAALDRQLAEIEAGVLDEAAAREHTQLLLRERRKRKQDQEGRIAGSAGCGSAGGGGRSGTSSGTSGW